MNLRRLPSWRFLICTALLAAIPLIVARFRRPPEVVARPYKFPNAQVAALDKVVQARFQVVPNSDFGVGRIGERHEYFKPTTEAERAAIRDITRARQEVAFYVVPRNVFKEQTNWLGWSPVQGPVYMTARRPESITGPDP